MCQRIWSVSGFWTFPYISKIIKKKISVILAVVSFKLAPPNWGFNLYCVNGTCGICSDVHTCIFRAVSVTFHHLQALFTPGVNIHLGWSQLVRQDRLLFTHMPPNCVFCDHLWVLSSGRSLILWLLHYISLLLRVDEELHLKHWWIFSLIFFSFRSCTQDGLDIHGNLLISTQSVVHAGSHLTQLHKQPLSSFY